MSRLSRSSHIALWAAVFSLLLKAAVPLLAATAAEWRGVPVASVCAIYGVAMPTLPDGGHAAHAGHSGHAEHGAQVERRAQTEHTAQTDHTTQTEHTTQIEHRAQAEDIARAAQGTNAAHGAHAAHDESTEHPAHAGPPDASAHAAHGDRTGDEHPSGLAHDVLHADADHAGPASHHGDPSHAEDSHGAGHCALSALAALAVPDPTPGVAPRVREAAPDHMPARAVAFHDASAAWIARLKHGPPAAA